MKLEFHVGLPFPLSIPPLYRKLLYRGNTSGIIHLRRYPPVRGDPSEYTLFAFISSCGHTAYPAARSILLWARPCSSRSRVTLGSFSTRVRRGIPVQNRYVASARCGKHAPPLPLPVKRSRKGAGCERWNMQFSRFSISRRNYFLRMTNALLTSRRVPAIDREGISRKKWKGRKASGGSRWS